MPEVEQVVTILSSGELNGYFLNVRCNLKITDYVHRQITLMEALKLSITSHVLSPKAGYT